MTKEIVKTLDWREKSVTVMMEDPMRLVARINSKEYTYINPTMVKRKLVRHLQMYLQSRKLKNVFSSFERAKEWALYKGTVKKEIQKRYFFFVDIKRFIEDDIVELPEFKMTRYFTPVQHLINGKRYKYVYFTPYIRSYLIREPIMNYMKSPVFQKMWFYDENIAIDILRELEYHFERLGTSDDIQKYDDFLTQWSRELWNTTERVYDGEGIKR